MISFWERNSFQKYDIVIIGAGITGLSSAISIKELNPQASILILERGILPTGASTKNAGFACFGSPSEIFDDYDRFGKDTALALVEDRIKGLEILKGRIGEKELDLKYNGGYELIFDSNDRVLLQMENLNEDLKPILGSTTFFDSSEKINSFHFRKVKNLIYTPFEGQLNPGKMMRALWQKAASMGILIFTGSNAVSIEDHSHYVEVATEKMPFQCKKLVVCTNAFAAELIPDLGIRPARGLVVATSPLKNIPFKGSFHFEKGFYYFRNFEDRVIFGGGRNLDIENEETTSFEVNEKILTDLKEKLTNIIVPDTKLDIELVWTGIMAFGKTKHPVIKKHSDNVAVAVGLGGMGVALSGLIGQKIALLINRV